MNTETTVVPMSLVLWKNDLNKGMHYVVLQSLWKLGKKKGTTSNLEAKFLALLAKGRGIIIDYFPWERVVQRHLNDFSSNVDLKPKAYSGMPGVGKGQ